MFTLEIVIWIENKMPTSSEAVTGEYTPVYVPEQVK